VELSTVVLAYNLRGRRISKFQASLGYYIKTLSPLSKKKKER
jgi:hypothetical protein